MGPSTNDWSFTAPHGAHMENPRGGAAGHSSPAEKWAYPAPVLLVFSCQAAQIGATCE